MKYTSAIVLLLVNNIQAIKVRDIGDLELPELRDDNDIKIEQDISNMSKKVDTLNQQDAGIINEFEQQLSQGLRNAEQGEMGRALAVSKLQNIKLNIQTLESNFKTEAQTIQEQSKDMLMKHQPVELDLGEVSKLEKQANEVQTKIPEINELEKNLEI